VQQVGIKYYICNIVARKMYNIKVLGRFSENTPLSNFMKIRPVGAKLFHVGAWTDRRDTHDEVNGRFLQFANAPKKCE
jgi:hypothetical protein